MTLRYTLDTLDGVEEACRPFYAEAADGKFTLQVEDAASRAELDGLRDANLALRREIEATNQRFAGIDPDAFRALLRQQRAERDMALIEAGRIDEVLAPRVQAMVAEHQRIISELAAERESLRAEAEAVLIDASLRTAAARAGVLPEALEDVLLRGSGVFRALGGRAIAHAGDEPILGSDGELMGADEWLATIGVTLPHLFAESQSGGAPGAAQAAAALGGTMTRAAWERLDPAARREAALTRRIVG